MSAMKRNTSRSAPSRGDAQAFLERVYTLTENKLQGSSGVAELIGKALRMRRALQAVLDYHGGCSCMHCGDILKTVERELESPEREMQ